MSEFRPIKNFLNRWLGPLEASRKPAQIPQRAQGVMKQAEHPNTQADKAANAGDIKTFGSGKESMAIYGAVPLSRERIQAVQEEAKKETLEHEKEVTAPILSFQSKRTEFGSTMGALGLTDPAIIRGVQEWERRQRELFAPFKVDVTSGTLPVKTFH